MWNAGNSRHGADGNSEVGADLDSTVAQWRDKA
jgi:hypothetical protein